MKNLMTKTVSIMLVAVCMMGTTAFADVNDNNSQEIIEIQPCKAIDLIGGIPDFIQGPDREDLEAMLNAIDEYTSAGQLEQAENIWTSVNEMIALYQEQFGPKPSEIKSDEDFIQEEIQRLEELIQRCENAENYERADEYRHQLDQLLLEVFGDNNPDMMNNDNQDPDLFNEHNEDPDAGFEGELSPDDVKTMVEETEAEIERLEQAGDFEVADTLKNELEGFLNDYFGNFKDPMDHNQDPDFEEPEHGFKEGEIISLEELMNRIGHELSPEEVEILAQLVQEVNAMAHK